jgi:hypothetical protein
MAQGELLDEKQAEDLKHETVNDIEDLKANAQVQDLNPRPSDDPKGQHQMSGRK